MKGNKMSNGIDMTVNSEVKGSEGLDIKVDYQNTDLKTVVLVQYAQVMAFARIIRKQATQLGVDLSGLE
jgi:hypothetical protein